MRNAETIRKVLRAALCMLALIPALAPAVMTDPARLSAQAARTAGTAGTEEMVTRLIVKTRYRTGDQLNKALHAHDASGLAKIADVPLSELRPMLNGAHVIHLNKAVTLSEARVIAARLMRDSSVEYAQPDRRKHPLAAVTPNDPDFSNQWNLFTPSSSDLGGADLPNAWGVTTGSAAVTVAVIDTGYRPHGDLSNALLPGGSPGYGYDFISDIPTANDGDGRDADASDPGDWVNAADLASGNFPGCTASDIGPSSWHGTHVAGIIAATINNSTGIAGVAPSIKILPVRVLGKCGGFDDDIVDGMYWAAGISTDPDGETTAPANSYPARVLNLSLGGPGSCTQLYKDAITAIINAGALVVVAAGNDGTTTLSEPANCSGVIAVTAHVKTGDNADYSNIGAGTFISAPGGGCGGTNPSCDLGVYSLWNTGTTVPASDSYTYYQGTSMATPHVSGAIALMLSQKPALTSAQIKSLLQSSARPFPSNTLCTQTAYLNMCGAGMLDVYGALQAVNNLTAPVVTLGGGIPSIVAPGDTVTLSGNAVASSGRSISSYLWTQQTGSTVAIKNASSNLNAYFIAPATGTYSFKLTATDNTGQTGSATTNAILVNSPPVLTTSFSTQTVAAGQTLSFTVTASDPDGNAPIYHLVSLLPTPTNKATLNASTGKFSWLAMPVGNYTLTYYASDQYGASSSMGTVNITVTSAPAASSGGSGGGSLDGGTLSALALLAVALRLRRRQRGNLK
jgi:serine protease